MTEGIEKTKSKYQIVNITSLMAVQPFSYWGLYLFY